MSTEINSIRDGFEEYKKHVLAGVTDPRKIMAAKRDYYGGAATVLFVLEKHSIGDVMEELTDYHDLLTMGAG